MKTAGVAVLVGPLITIAAGCGGGETIAKGLPAIEGTWHESYTRAEYIRAGADASEQSIPGNWGSFVLTFHPGGHYTLTKTDPPHGESHGSYRLAGKLVTLKCTCDPYPTWPYHWSVYRGALVFRRAAPSNPSGGVSEPTGFVVKPWRRGP